MVSNWLIMLKNLWQMQLKLLQKESFCNNKSKQCLIGNTIANKNTNLSKNSETVTNEHDKEIPKYRIKICFSGRKAKNC